LSAAPVSQNSQHLAAAAASPISIGLEVFACEENVAPHRDSSGAFGGSLSVQL
jgi:hypothetical protein